MSAEAGIERVYRAVEEAAGLLEVPCSREAMWPALTAFEEVLLSPTVFTMVTSGGRVGDLSFDFATAAGAGDPYAIAVSHGLVKETDHPVRALFPDLHQRFPVHTYGVDYGVVGGFNKSYISFPLGDLQRLEELAGVPSMPPGLAEHAELFARYGLADRVSALAVDYAQKTWNVYFNGLSAEHVERTAVVSMLDAFGLPEPSERLLDFIATSSALYPTFGWDSPAIERVSFSTRTTGAPPLPGPVGAELGKLARGAPYTYEGERVLVYAGAVSRGEEYYKLAAYHEMASAAHDRVRSAS